MRSLLVVVAPPGLEHGAGMRQRSEQRLVQQLVAQPAIEALVVAVLLGLARRDVMPADAGLVGPAEDGVATPASCSRRIAITCSSVNRDRFILPSLPWGGR